ncbi:MAG TPA: efflux RND transporter periplasmic adaptor subunit [Candidatus Paceibacterota bacterium]|nr:efflux RND transporter periplasmic adaptor subunit [Candidatus Paceibacterota bacterium]
MNYFSSFGSYVRRHKIVSLFAVLIIAVAVYYGFFHSTSKAETQYVIGTVQKGTVTAGITEAGQISSQNKVDIKPKASGDITYVAAKKGQTVKSGQLIAQLDTTDAQKNVRDAQLALDNAKVALQKFQLDQSSSQQDRDDNLTKSYTDAVSQISSTFLSLVDVMQGTDDVLYANTLKGDCTPNLCQYANYGTDTDEHDAIQALATQAQTDYNAARAAYDPALATYRTLRLDETDEDTIATMLDTTISVLKLEAQAIKSEQNLLDAVSDAQSKNRTVGANGQVINTIPAQVTNYQGDLAGYASTINSRLSSVTSSRDSIRSIKQSIQSSQLGDPLDLANQQNSVAQKEAALQDAKDALADLYVRAPFDGVLADVPVQRGDSVSSGTTVATIYTQKSIADISLNETDIANIHEGQKATLTFDALPDVTLTGTVISVDSLGTVSQGVVSYNAQVALDVENDKVKPGMSTTVTILSGVSTDVLMVPTTAVRQTNGQWFVQTITGVDVGAAGTTTIGSAALPAQPEMKQVEIGLQGDTETEIKSGLAEGDEIVTRTIMPSSSSSTAQTNTRAFGGTTGGGAVRVQSLGGGNATFVR